jgi:putative inorganic carbon (hco3(-)) transporter
MKINGILKKVGWPVMIGILILVAMLGGFLAANKLAFVTFAIGGALLGALVVYSCLFHPLSGYYLTTLVAFFAFYPSRVLNRDLPITTFTEVLVLFLFLGTYWHVDQHNNRKGHLLKSGISILLLINVFYFAVQVFNPNTDTIAGWLFSSKRYAVYILFFFISYKLINTPARFRYFLKFWVIMAFIAAAYGCMQQWIGLTPWENRYLMNDPHEYALLFQGGVVRKFSFLDGVVTFGSLAGSFAVITLILAMHEKNKKKKYQLFFATLILFLGMSYSGTRTFTIMMPAGIALYVLMTLKNRTTLVLLFSTIVILVFIFFAPINSPTLNRMRSTLDTNDESLNVRTINRHSIQPYIYQHPFGGGVAASGVEGMRFNPRHRLAGFPPDSGLLKLALDMGWVGLALTMLLYLMILYQGIVYYFTIKNPEYRLYMVAITCALFSIFVTLYSQVTIGQIPNAFFFYAVMALFTRLKEFDQNEREGLIYEESNQLNFRKF